MNGSRVGTGFDAHRLVPGRALVLGGVRVPHTSGLQGHSDGDCLIHALCDALLGAAGLGDMGAHFPSSDETWRDASSLVFLSRVKGLLDAEGYSILNVDATLIAEAPRLGPFLSEMKNRLAQALGVRETLVSVKAKSTDALGALGRGEGIAAQAVALLGREEA